MKPSLAYQPGTSYLHRLHPLVKAGWLIALTVLVFAVRRAGSVLVILSALWLLSRSVHLSLGRVRGGKLLLSTALLLMVLQLVFVDEGRRLVEMGPLTITGGGLAAGVYVAARFLSVVLSSYLFVFTTSPSDLAYGLMQVGLPYRFGFTLVTALRLVPIFEREARMVYRAQIMRGAAYDRGGPARFLSLARQFLLPMLVSALSKVDALAVSMEGRCFGKYPRRTYLREVRLGRPDAWAMVLLSLVVILIILFPI